jgi:murein DD-endopeptidase MepM/ murein hydrolase activator NlpD
MAICSSSKNNDGTSYLYAHMKDVFVKEDQKINAGDIFQQ